MTPRDPSSSARAGARIAPVWLLVGATALGPMAMNIFVPAMPGLVAAFHTDIPTVSLTLSLYLLALGVGQLFCGPIADRWGRRPTMLGGLVVYVASALFCLFAGTIGELIVGRVAQALGGCAAVVVVRAIIRDSYDRARGASVLAFVTMAMAVAPALSPALGGYLVAHFDWRAGFIVLAAVGVVFLFGALRRLPETQAARYAGGGLGALLAGYRSVLPSPVFGGFALCLAFTSGTFFAFVAGAPFVVVQLMQRTETEYGVSFMIVSGGYMIGSFLASRWSVRFGTDRMVILGTAIAFAGCAGLAACQALGVLGLLTLFGSMGVIAIGNGISQPNAIAAAVEVDPRAAGTASGIVGFAQMAVGACATFLVAQLSDGTTTPLIVVMVLSTLIGALSYVVAALSDRAATAQRFRLNAG